MSLKTFVKIGKIDNLSDARYCAGMMVDILGFNLEEGTEGYVSPENYKEISEWVAGVEFCGEFANAEIAEIKLATTQYELNYLEVQKIDHLEELADMGTKLIYKLVINSTEELEQIANKLDLVADLVEHVIISSTDSELFDQIESQLSNLKSEVSLIRGYDINTISAPQVPVNNVFSGIELEGSPEDRPGYKDYGIVMDILEELEED